MSRRPTARPFAPASDWGQLDRFVDGQEAASIASPEAGIAGQAPTVTVAPGPSAVAHGGVELVTASFTGQGIGIGIVPLTDGGVLARWWIYDGAARNWFGQRYDADGNAVGGVIPVPGQTAPSHYPDSQELVSLANGGFLQLLVEDDVSHTGIFAQRYDANFSPVGGKYQVNSFTANFQDTPSAVNLTGGRLLIYWESDDGYGKGISGQLYDAAGAKIGAEFRMNASTTYTQLIPQIAALPGGGFLATWVTIGASDVSIDTYARRFDANAVPLAPEFRVNTYTAGFQSNPTVELLDNGNTIVCWDGAGASGAGVWAQLYDPAGVAIGGNFRLDSVDGANRSLRGLTAMADGEAAIGHGRWRLRRRLGDQRQRRRQ